VLAIRFDSIEQRHSRGNMTASHRHVVCDHFPVANESMMLDCDIWTQIGSDRGQDLSPALPTLGARRVVHHVFGDQLVDDSLIACRTTAKQRFDDCLRLIRHN